MKLRHRFSLLIFALSWRYDLYYGGTELVDEPGGQRVRRTKESWLTKWIKARLPKEPVVEDGYDTRGTMSTTTDGLTRGELALILLGLHNVPTPSSDAPMRPRTRPSSSTLPCTDSRSSWCRNTWV